MGYAVIMLVILLLMAVSIALSANYGIAKDSEKAPLLAENAYAERETGKAQTALTINYTCLVGPRSQWVYYFDVYAASTTTGDPAYPNSGYYNLYLGIRNNGSEILNSTLITVLYNSSQLYTSSILRSNTFNPSTKNCQTPNLRTLLPLNYSCIYTTSNKIYIPLPRGDPGPVLRVSVSAENGISTIAPTSPINFTGINDTVKHIINLNWNASYDEDGIAFYRLYGFYSANQKNPYTCPFPQSDPYPTDIMIDNINSTSYSYNYSILPLNHFFFVKAVDNLQNEGIQSRAIYCDEFTAPACIWSSLNAPNYWTN